jgi:hypothetical protein
VPEAQPRVRRPVERPPERPPLRAVRPAAEVPVAERLPAAREPPPRLVVEIG